MQQNKAKSSNSDYELVFPVTCFCICVEEIPNHMIEIDMQTYKWLLLQPEIFFFLRSLNLPVWIHSNYCSQCYYCFPNYSWPVSPLLVLWRLLFILNKVQTLEMNLNCVEELVFVVRVICKVLKVRSRNEGEGLEEASTTETADLGTLGRQSLILREVLFVRSESPCGLRAGSEVV